MALIRSCCGDLEQLRPRLAPGVTLTRFGDDIVFLHGNGHSLKLDDASSALVAEFTGERSLADLIAARLSTGDTAVFDRLLTLMTRLTAAGMFDADCAAAFRRAAPVNAPWSGGDRRWPLFTVRPGGLAALKGKILLSTPGLLLTALLAAAAALMPSLQGTNLLIDLTGGLFPPGIAYLLAIVFLAFFLSAILSVRALLSAAGLAARGLAAPVALRCRYGLFQLSVDDTPVVALGRPAAVRHHLLLLLTPFALAGIAALLGRAGLLPPLMALIHTLALFAGLYAASPLLRSDLTTLIGFFTTGEGHTATFLRRRFLLDLFSPHRHAPETDRLILLSALGLLWFSVSYNYLWYVAQNTISHLLADMLSADGLTLALISCCLLLLVLPLLLMAVSLLTMLAGNLENVARTPLSRMRRLAAGITAHRVPATARITAFLKQIPLFSGLSDAELIALCAHIRVVRYGAGQRVVAQGDRGDRFYTIVAGQTQVVVQDRAGRETAIENLSTGDSFGETALLEQVPRTASIITTARTVLFEIDRDGFEQFVVASAGGRTGVTDAIRLGKLLLAAPLFSFMSPRQVAAAVRRLIVERHPRGATIFSQGDPGDRFYLIKEGTVRLRRSEEETTTLDVTLGAGQFFGEMALIRDIPRTATATAADDVIVATLTKEQFHDLIGHSLFSGRELDAVMRERAAQLGKEALLACSSD